MRDERFRIPALSVLIHWSTSWLLSPLPPTPSLHSHKCSNVSLGRTWGPNSGSHLIKVPCLRHYRLGRDSELHCSWLHKSPLWHLQLVCVQHILNSNSPPVESCSLLTTRSCTKSRFDSCNYPSFQFCQLAKLSSLWWTLNYLKIGTIFLSVCWRCWSINV